MAHAFKTIPGKPAFGTLKQVVFQSDYLGKKKAQRTVCTSQANCGKIKNAKSYEQVNQHKEGFRLNAAKRCNILPFNKSDLIVNLYSKMNLKYACTMINGYPCINPELSDVSCSLIGSNIPKCCSNACSSVKTITPGSSNPFNWNNTIDPLGNLFGNSQCGIQNYTQYMVFNPPNNINNLVDISNSAAIGDANSGNIDNALFAIQNQEMLRTSLFSINSATDESLASINSKMLDATSTIMDMTSNSSLALNEQLLKAIDSINNAAFNHTDGKEPYSDEQLTEIKNNLLNKINYIFETFFHADAETIIANYPMAN
jgi:hypothetical protein